MALHRYITHLRQLLTLRCLARLARATRTTRKESPIEPLREIEKAIPINNSKNVLTENTLEAGRDIYIGDQITYVNQHGEELKKIPRLLTGLPFVPEGFQGRYAELHYIHEHLFGDNHHLLLLVNGEGGVGKTSLASRYFYTHQDQYAHLAWVFSEKNLGSALLQMAIPLGLQFDERADTLARLQVLLQNLFELQKPCLLIIDNANELAELRQYLPLLQRCSNFHLLFTTRVSDLPQVAFYKIAPLPQDLALQVFKSHYPAFEQQEESLFYEIYEAVKGNTLVLELLAKNLRNFNNKLKKHYLLADLRRDLERGLLQLSKSSTVEVRYQAKGQGLRSEKMELIIAAMYELGDLSEVENQLLAVFAVLPAESIPFERLETLLPDWENLDQEVLALAQKGWLEYNEEAAAFKCSPVVQEVVRLKQKDFLLEHCRTLISALCEQLDEEHRHVDNYLHANLFVRYGESLLAALAVADDDLGTLCQNIGNFYSETGDLSKALAVYQHMQWIQTSLSEENPDDPDLKNGLAISYSKLGDTHSDLGNLNQALTFFEDETKLFEELYAAYPQNVSFKNGLAISYSKLGDTHSDLGNLNQALTFFEKDIELSKELYASYPQNVAFKNGLAISYQWLGITHRSLNNLEQALHSFQEFRVLEEELFKGYPLNVSFKNNLAYAHKFLGLFYRDQKNDPIQARIYLQQCHDLWQELTTAFPAYAEFNENYTWAKEALETLDLRRVDFQ